MLCILAWCPKMRGVQLVMQMENVCNQFLKEVLMLPMSLDKKR